jgi:hypothetical protein
MRVRLTIRGLMGAVALVALILALGVYFWRSEDLEENLSVSVVNETSTNLYDLNWDFKGPDGTGGGTTSETAAPGRICTMTVGWSGRGPSYSIAGLLTAQLRAGLSTSISGAGDIQAL